jgi:hypothetical protein
MVVGRCLADDLDSVGARDQVSARLASPADPLGRLGPLAEFAEVGFGGVELRLVLALDSVDVVG